MKEKKKKIKILNVRIEESLHEFLRERAFNTRRSMSTIVEFLIKEARRKHEKAGD
jgi:hypothetical protein